MERILGRINWGLVFIILVLAIPVMHSQTQGKQWHVAGIALPLTTPAAPSTIEGGSLAAVSVVVDSVVLTNTDSVAHTATIVDCQSSAFYVLKDASIAANSSWMLPLSGIRMQGCFKWSANSTTVMGAAVGMR